MYIRKLHKEIKSAVPEITKLAMYMKSPFCVLGRASALYVQDRKEEAKSQWRMRTRCEAAQASKPQKAG